MITGWCKLKVPARVETLREWSLRIQQTGAEGIVLEHGIFCHDNVGV